MRYHLNQQPRKGLKNTIASKVGGSYKSLKEILDNGFYNEYERDFIYHVINSLNPNDLDTIQLFDSDKLNEPYFKSYLTPKQKKWLESLSDADIDPWQPTHKRILSKGWYEEMDKVVIDDIIKKYKEKKDKSKLIAEIKRKII